MVATATNPLYSSQALASGKPTVVEFGANACAACRDIEAGSQGTAAVVGRPHRDRRSRIPLKEQDIAVRYGVQLMPTQLFFAADGREIGRNAGRIGGEEILARLGAAGTAR